MGNGKTLSELTGINVIYDFRANDLRNGGHGAPLVPVYHKLLYKKLELKLPTVFVNIGGIANITYLDKNNKMISFDSGPGNFLIDKLLQLKSNYRNGKAEGAWIHYHENGTVDEEKTGTFKNGKKISD